MPAFAGDTGSPRIYHGHEPRACHICQVSLVALHFICPSVARASADACNADALISLRKLPSRRCKRYVFLSPTEANHSDDIGTLEKITTSERRKRRARRENAFK